MGTKLDVHLCCWMLVSTFRIGWVEKANWICVFEYAYYNCRSVDMSGISEGCEGSSGCEVGDCSDISQVINFLMICKLIYI